MHGLSRQHPVPVLAGGHFGLVASNPLKPGVLEGQEGSPLALALAARTLEVWWRGDLVTEGTSRSGT